ncbi:dnaJ homolog subfamily C member 11 isoform X3 [Anabrus simplex]|uniref:dnaJ homolog subfamily C member 11 isoform X3 n=1 Tax=Anabrus simplex TaxID=316456 RepID=UPI0034DD0C33
MDDENEDGAVIEEDYYAFLNVSRNATNEEINNAYRRLSRLYHPDKHVDPVRKAEAEQLFSKTKKAYEVLSDPHQRAIYDSLGIRGLATEGWEIVQRTKTPQEIREEYENLARERAERRLQQRTNPKGNVTVNINATDIFSRYEDEFDFDERAGTFGAVLEYGAEKKVSQHSSVAAAVSLGVPSGIILRVKLSRASQTYSFPIHLSEEILPSPVFYATVTPILVWAIVKKLVIDPMVRDQKERDKEKQRETNKNRMAEKKREAQAAVNLMRATFARVRSDEEAKKGLVIVKALYGRLLTVASLSNPPASSEGEGEDAPAQQDEVIDVTIPLQCLVKDSKLVLHESSKSQLPGFYDPCMGEEKSLMVQYLYHNQLHEVTVGDTEPLRIPKQTHRVNPT